VYNSDTRRRFRAKIKKEITHTLIIIFITLPILQLYLLGQTNECMAVFILKEQNVEAVKNQWLWIYIQRGHKCTALCAQRFALHYAQHYAQHYS
jgi:heme/copper-type cytochrome/quinol oxidase subunit 2